MGTSWKVCGDADLSLRGIPPQQLFDLANSTGPDGRGFDLGVLSKFSYSVYPELWGAPNKTEITELMALKKPIVLDTRADHAGDKVVVDGGRIFYLRFNAKE